MFVIVAYLLLTGVPHIQAQPVKTNVLSVPQRITKIVDGYPMLSPDASLVVFQSNRAGNIELYTMKPDGTDVKQLTRTAYDEGTPVWSPDGKQILYAAEMGEGNEEVLLMNVDGNHVRRLTNHPASDGHPHWSPDGTRIIFNSARTTPDLKEPWGRQWHEIFSMKTDGSDLRQLTKCKSVCTYGVMSPDGQWLLFSSNRNGKPLVGELFVVRPDGIGLRQISTSKESLVQPSWSKDGRRIFAAQYTLDEEAASIVVLSFGTTP